MTLAELIHTTPSRESPQPDDPCARVILIGADGAHTLVVARATGEREEG
jgi:hypothetical protein